MPAKRSDRGFQRAGSVRFGRGVLAAGLARNLRLVQVWMRLAGPAISRRATPLGVRRGVLEVEVLEPEHGWARTLREILPRLAGQLAAALPELGVRKLRIRVRGEHGKPRPAVDLPPSDPAVGDHARHGGPRAGRVREPEAEASGAGSAELQLPDLMERYLDRRRERLRSRDER